LKTEDAPTELENFKMRNCNVYWIETQLELGKELAVSNWQIGAKSLLLAKEYSNTESNTEKQEINLYV